MPFAKKIVKFWETITRVEVELPQPYFPWKCETLKEIKLDEPPKSNVKDIFGRPKRKFKEFFK